MKHPPIIEAYEGLPPHQYFSNLNFFDVEKGEQGLEGLEFKRNLYFGACGYGAEFDDAGKTRYINFTQHREIPREFIESAPRARAQPVMDERNTISQRSPLQIFYKECPDS